MGRGLIKAIRGAATAGAELSLMQIKENMLAKRDERLRSFQAGENQKDRDMRASQFEQSHELAGRRVDLEESGQRMQEEQFNTRTNLQRQGLEMQAERLKMDAGELEQRLELLDLQIRDARLGLVDRERLEAVRSVLLDPSASEDAVKQAGEVLSRATPRPAQPLRIENVRLMS